MFLPGFTGPIHLHPNAFLLLGLYTPIATTTPYATFTAPLTAVTLGVEGYDQAVALTSGGPEMSNVDAFKL